MLRRLKSCKVSKENTSYTFTLTSVTLSAENNALQKASTTQPMGLPIIPQPEKGVAGKGFNLRAAMDLEENNMLYCTVHVSSMLLLLLPCLIIHSVVFGTWWTEPDWIALYLGTANQKKLLVRSLEL
jgi:hypothetical protein